jgi:predicted RNase H-like nuclease (RuvC/YqgF family)
LRKELEAKCLEIAALVKVNQEVRGRLEAKENEVNSYISILNTKNQEYDRMVKNNSEEKSNLIRIVRRLEDEKRMLESVNSSAKGDISSQIKQNQDLINRNQTLSKEMDGIANQLAVTRS